MNAESLIFLVIVGLVVVVQLLRWAIHKRRNKSLGLPANAELSEKYDADRMPPPAVGDEPEPGHMTLRGGWQEPGPRT